jgi:surfactin synthase thioesterase subunit
MTAVACFPGAGSFGGEFQALLDQLGPAARLVRYPGRYGRGFGVPAPSFDALVTGCAEQVTGPTVLFGHSFGAYVAYATALRVPAATLVVAGAAAPARMTVPDHAIGSPADAARYLDDIDPGVLAAAPSPDWRDIVVETAIQDLRLLTGFDAAAAAPVDCPLVAVRGSTDPLTTDAGIADWAACTTAAFRAHAMPGGHSDYLRTEAFTTWLRGML